MKHVLSLILSLIIASLAFAEAPSVRLDGKWTFEKEKSTNLATWRYRMPQLKINTSAKRVTILRQWLDRNRIAFTDSVTFEPGGAMTLIPIVSPIWTGNWYMGVLAKQNSTQSVSGKWIQAQVALRTVAEETIEISQGETRITTTTEYRLSPDGNTLTVTEQRSSRPTPVVLVFTRSDAN